eukprot:1149374-Pelagomonas_calceolata.AAC.2
MHGEWWTKDWHAGVSHGSKDVIAWHSMWRNALGRVIWDKPTCHFFASSWGLSGSPSAVKAGSHKSSALSLMKADGGQGTQ